MSNSLSIYNGSEPYIFVSYAHKDTQRVMPLIQGLQRRGFRVWYDNGIGGGSKFAMIIAEHLGKCHCMIAFLTPNYDASEYCRMEVTFALDRKKPALPVYLDDFTPSDGLYFLLCTGHALYMSNFAGNEDFLDKVETAPLLQPCRGAIEPPAQPAPQPVNQPVQQPMPQPMQQPMNRPMQQPMQQPMNRPMQQPMQQPMNRPMQQPMNRPMQQPMQQPMNRPMQQPMQQPMNRPMQQPMQQPMNRPMQQPMQQPMNRPMQQPMQQPMNRPVQQPMQQPANPPRPNGPVNKFYGGKAYAPPSHSGPTNTAAQFPHGTYNAGAKPGNTASQFPHGTYNASGQQTGQSASKLLEDLFGEFFGNKK